MRHKGRLTDWRDERGFGFVTPLGGGTRAFVHISAFANRRRRPVGNELVTYALRRDAKGRWQATDVALCTERKRRSVGSGRGTGALVVSGGFLAGLTAAALAAVLPPVVPGYYAATSLAAFLAYAWDKAAARSGGWRTREGTLHVIGLLGGWPGALVAQRVLRHKSRKTAFQAIFWLTVLVNCGALLWWLATGGAPWG